MEMAEDLLLINANSATNNKQSFMERESRNTFSNEKKIFHKRNRHGTSSDSLGFIGTMWKGSLMNHSNSQTDCVETSNFSIPSSSPERGHPVVKE
jgi:hypothetical protein